MLPSCSVYSPFAVFTFSLLYPHKSGQSSMLTPSRTHANTRIYEGFIQYNQQMEDHQLSHSTNDQDQDHNLKGE